MSLKPWELAKLLGTILFLILSAANCPPAMADISQEQCPTVELEYEGALPYIEQTYGTCFAEAATQALDYHRLANGVEFFPATFQTLGPIYAQSLQGKAYSGDNYMSSSILMTIDYQIKQGNSRLSSLDDGGNSLVALETMAKKNGCIATPFDLMPSKDRRILVEEIATKLKHLQDMLRLPPLERWDFFVQHFSTDAWIGSLVGTKITREMIESPADTGLAAASPLEKLKIAFEKMVCPVRTITYPSYSINAAETSDYPGWISRNLVKNRRPVIMRFCSEVIENPLYRGSSTYPRFSNEQGCGRHAALVMGQRWNPERKICQFKVRNWWGKNYRYSDFYNPDGKGSLYMWDLTLQSNVYGAMQIVDKK